MRFFKIFLICFFSLIGTVSGVIGIMYVAGALNQKIVEPEAISFELSEYNLDGDTVMTIFSTTPEVTATAITLSLPNQVESINEDNGETYITNEIITVPQTVYIGQPFIVEVYSEYDTDLGKNWIVGGSTTLTAKSESLRPNQISASVNVDVPVESVEVITYTNSTDHTTSSTFAVGETFYAEAVFSPTRSMYKYGSQTETKTVFFDISTNQEGVIEENTDSSNLAGNVKLYNVLSSTLADIKVYAYCFETSSLENTYMEEYNGNVESLIGELKSSNNNISSNANLITTNRTVGSFTINFDSNEKTLEFNKTNKIYANKSGVERNANFGIQIKDNTDELNTLQNKIRDVGVVAYVKNGTTYTLATNEDIIFVNALGNAISTKTQTNGGITYYLPNAVSTNIDNSFWNIVALKENLTLKFELYLFDNGDTISLDSPKISTEDELYKQTWKTLSADVSTLIWSSINDINLTVIDNVDPTKVNSEEFDISSIVSLSEGGTYQTVKYLAYSINDLVDLSTVLSDCVATEKFAISGIEYNLFELNSTILKPNSNCEFEVIAVIIKTDYLGQPIFVNDQYQIYKFITDGTTAQTYKNVSVTVNKTVKSLSAFIEVTSDDLLGNNTDEEVTELDRIAFSSNSGNTSVFDIVFKIEATEETLLKEVQIFAEAYNNGSINFNAYVGANTTQILVIDKPSVLTINTEEVSGTEWEYRFNVFTSDCERDTEIRIIWSYAQTPSTILNAPIKNVEFDGDLTDLTYKENVDWAVIEVYDARVATVEFEYDNDSETKLTETITIEQGTAVYENVFFATEPRITYFDIDDADITSEILTEDNKYKINFYDRFGNALTSVSSTDYVIRTTSVGKVIEVTNHANSISSNPTDTLYLETATSGTIQSVGQNNGVIENGEWSGDDITNNFTTIAGFAIGDEISISRYGIIQEGIPCVQITGSNGLLSVLYEHSGTTFELCNILTYSFLTNITDLASVISYNSATGALTLLKHINKQLELVLSVNSGLGFSFNVKLLIKPNIVLTIERTTAQGILSDVPDSTGFYSVYSDNNVVFTLKFAMTLKEAFVITANSFHFVGEGNPTEATISLDSIAQEIQFVVNFNENQLGNNTIIFATGASAFDFYCELKINVEPNLKLANNTSLISKTIEVSALETPIEVLNASDYARVIGSSEIDLSAITLTFSKVLYNNSYFDEIYFNGATTPVILNNVLSVIDNNSITILNTMEGYYNIVLKLNYGGETIGTIEVLINTNIKPNETNEDFSSMFAYYNGTQCLVLVSGQSYSQETLIALFDNVTYFALPQNPEIYTYNPTENSYVIQTLSNYIYRTNILQLKNEQGEVDIASINYPILFSPLNIGYINYAGGTDSENLETINSDFGKLNNASQLFSNNIYDEYSSGGTVSLFTSESKTFGFSPLLKEQNLTYEVFLQNEDGTISNIRYGSYNVANGTLTTDSSSQDKFVYLVIYDSETSYQIGLYRLKIVANSAINIYYPYANSYLEDSDTISAEYIYETDNNEIIINLDQTLLVKYPNNLSSTDTKRVMLQIGNVESGFTNSSDYTVSYQILKITHFNEEIKNIMTIINEYGVSLDTQTNQLYISKLNNQIERIFEIIIQCTVTSGDVNMGIVNYIIKVNNPELKKYDVRFRETPTSTATTYSETTKEIAYESSYNFSKIYLYKTQNDVSTPATDVQLNYHFYIDGKIASDYLTFDDVNKTLSIKEGVELVSNLKVKFLYYIPYGEVLTTELTFLSNFNTQFVADNGLTANISANTYEVFADTTFNLKNVFLIKNGVNTIDVSTINYSYIIDNQTEIDGNEISFTQILTATANHTIKVIVHLYDFDSETYKDNYQFEFNLIVKQSLKTNASSTALTLTNSIKFQTANYELNNVLLSTVLGSTDTLFSVQDAIVLTGYDLSTSTQNQDYVTVVSTNLSTNTITLKFNKSPNESGKLITITFTLTKGSFTINAILRFTLISDVNIVINYPQPNDESELTEEKIFLDPTYVSGSTSETIWNDSNYLTINLSGNGYFGENRIQFVDSQNSETIVDYTTLSTRLTMNVYSIKQNATTADSSAMVVSYLNASSIRIYGTEITGVPFDSNILIQWRSDDVLDISASETMVLEILIDGVHREYYTIALRSDMSEIFTTTLNYLYENKTGIEGVDAEIFYVENASTEKLFSNQTALLTFTSRAQLTPTKLTAYVKDETEVLTKVGEITIGTNSSVYNLLLVGTKEIKSDLSNIIIKINDDTSEFVFTGAYTNIDNICKSYIAVNAYVLTYRLTIAYQNEILDYNQYVEKVKVASSTAVNSFYVDKKSLSNIETASPIEVPIKIDSQIIGYYKYKVLYDFVVGKSIEKTPDATEITAPNSLESGVDTFDITGLKGEYSTTYFQDNAVEFSAQVIMVTKLAFGSNPTTSNVLYMADNSLSYCQLINPNLGYPALNTNNGWIGISPKSIGETGISYDFSISAYGAENNGNYAFILVTYGAKNTTAKTYKIVKVKINPNLASMVLNNSDGTSNSEGTPLEVAYTGINALPKKLGTNGTTSDLIFLSNGNSTNLICDTNFLYTFTLNGEIANYLEIYENVGEKSLNLRAKSGTEAVFGNKYGYITIVDKYGYTENYYIVLYASSANALSLPTEEGIFINPIVDRVNQFYTGTEICIVKENYNEATDGELGDTSAVRIVNFKETVLDSGYTYTVSYRVDGVLLEESEDNIGILPNITENQKTVDLEIIISINTGTLTEDVVLTIEITLIKRFVLKTNSLSSTYVREGIAFDISNFITVEDVANLGNNIGDISISTKSKLLIVDSALVGNALTVSASTSGTASVIEQIIVGKDQNNRTMTAIGGKYYHILQLYSGLSSLNFENYEIGVSGTYSEGQVELVNDMVVYLVTSKIEESPTVSVKVNNGVEEYSLDYTLNVDGKQAKSIYQEIITDTSLTELQITNKLTNIYNYQISSDAISEVDLQTLKNFTIYNDTLAIKIKSGYMDSGITLNVKVFYDETNYKYADFDITNNNAHYKYISISNILGNLIDVSETYKIVVEYIAETSLGNLADLVAFDSSITYSSGSSINSTDETTTYTKTINTYAITITTNDIMKVLSASDFDSTKKKQNSKFYLVKYSNENTVEQVEVTYNITPKYYSIDNEGNIVANAKTVYANQYETSIDINGNKTYTVPFIVWASAFNLLDGGGNIIASLNNGVNLVFGLTGHNASGSATFNSNFDIVTNSYYNDGEYFVITVKVKVNEQTSELVEIGKVQVQLDSYRVFIAVEGMYSFIITNPNDLDSTVNTIYNFTDNIVSVYDMIMLNTNITNLVRTTEGVNEILIGSSYIPISTCNIEIVNIVDDIYSVEYNADGELEIKIKINESQTSLDKEITLQTQATKISNTSIVYNSESFGLQLNYSGGYYVTSTLTDTTQFIKQAGTEYYIIKIPIADMFTQTFIGTDFTYAVNVIGVNESNLTILYSTKNEVVNAVIEQTLLFKLAFVDTLGNNNSAVIGVKYTTDNQNFGGVYGYSIDISNLTSINGIDIADIKSYSISFLKAYDLDCVNDSSYDLLIGNTSGISTMYSIARIDLYKENEAFIVTDYANKLSSASSATIYEEEVIAYEGKHIPSLININPTAKTGIVYYYGTHNSTIISMTLLGLSTNTANELYIDVSSYTDNNYVVISNFNGENSSLSGNIYGISDGETTFWQGNINNGALLFGKATIALSSFEVDSTTITVYTFSDEVLLSGATLISMTLLGTTTADLTTIVSPIVSSTNYSFEVTDTVGTKSYVVIKGMNLGTVDVSSLVASYANGTYEIVLQDITTTISSAGTVTYVVYDINNQPIGVKAVAYSESGANFLSTTNPLLIGETLGDKAVESTTCPIAISAETMTYITIQNGTVYQYYAIYYDEATTFEYPIPALSGGDEIILTISTEGFAVIDNNPDATINFVCSASEALQSFKANDSLVETTFEIGISETTYALVLSDFGDTVNNLTITKL